MLLNKQWQTIIVTYGLDSQTVYKDGQLDGSPWLAMVAGAPPEEGGEVGGTKPAVLNRAVYTG